MERDQEGQEGQVTQEGQEGQVVRDVSPASAKTRCALGIEAWVDQAAAWRALPASDKQLGFCAPCRWPPGRR